MRGRLGAWTAGACVVFLSILVVPVATAPYAGTDAARTTFHSHHVTDSDADASATAGALGGAPQQDDALGRTGALRAGLVPNRSRCCRRSRKTPYQSCQRSADLGFGSGRHQPADDRRWPDSEGGLFAGSSNGFDAGQRAALERLGITRVPGSGALHAEEELLQGVPGLGRVGTSGRSPCALDKHNCAQQLFGAGVQVEP